MTNSKKHTASQIANKKRIAKAQNGARKALMEIAVDSNISAKLCKK